MSVDEAKSKCDGDVIALEYSPAQRRGFELSASALIALFLIGAAFVGLQIRWHLEYERTRQLQLQKLAAAYFGTMSKAIVAYQYNVGAYPVRLIDLCERPEDPVAASKWAGPYLQDMDGLIDPWGKPYFYAVSPSGAVGPVFRLASAGPDRVFGTADDIRNW